MGGTSAGKALHLAALGVGVRLCSPLGEDDDGRRVRRALAAAGVGVEEIWSKHTKPVWVDLHDCEDGAIAEDDGTRQEIPAIPATVVDTNGAGDAFMAGSLAATLRGATVPDALNSAATQARIAIESEHLHPVLGG